MSNPSRVFAQLKPPLNVFFKTLNSLALFESVKIIFDIFLSIQ